MAKKIIAALIVLAGVALAAGYYLFSTTRGNELLVKQGLSEYGEVGDVRLDMTGDIGQGLTIKDLELTDIKGLPEKSKVKIQKLFIQLESLGPDGLTIEIENARVLLPDSEPVILIGSCRGQTLDLNIYSRGLSIREVREYLPNLRGLIPLEGEVSEVDLYVKGPFQEPKVTGSFQIEKFLYKGFALIKSPWSVDVTLKDMESDLKLFGRAAMEGGVLKTNKVTVNFESGRIDFKGPWNKPDFQFAGSSKVEKTQIAINVRGTLEAPELALNSTPPYSREKLMVMLATGKSWQSIETALDTGAVSSDLTKDFVDYFFFAGKTNAFAERFGIRDVTVTYNGTKKGIGAKKGLTDSVEVGYAVEQEDKENGQAAVSQKFQGEVKVTNEVSVGVERETVRESKPAVLSETETGATNNDKIYLEYKKKF